jgi:hypothetical protein
VRRRRHGGESGTGMGSSSRPQAAATVASDSGAGSISATTSSVPARVPRPSNRATQAPPSRREGNHAALAPRSNRSAAIVWVTTRRLVQIEVLQAVRD